MRNHYTLNIVGMFPKLFFIFDRPNNHANIFGKNSLPHKKLKIKEVNLFFKKIKLQIKIVAAACMPRTRKRSMFIASLNYMGWGWLGGAGKGTTFRLYCMREE